MSFSTNSEFSTAISNAADVSCLLPATNANAILVQKKTVTLIDVARVRKLEDPRAPNTLPELPPPKAAPASAPLPC